MQNENFFLDDEEKEIENSFENYALSKNNNELRSSLISAAQNYALERGKKRVITLRVFDNDISLLKEKALRQGIPYQTLITSILHRYVCDDFIDKTEAKKIMSLQGEL